MFMGENRLHLTMFLCTVKDENLPKINHLMTSTISDIVGEIFSPDDEISLSGLDIMQKFVKKTNINLTSIC